MVAAALLLSKALLSNCTVDVRGARDVERQAGPAGTCDAHPLIDRLATLVALMASPVVFDVPAVAGGRAAAAHADRAARRRWSAGCRWWRR